MDIKQLKFLIALDQTRHFGQAARNDPRFCNTTVIFRQKLSRTIPSGGFAIRDFASDSSGF